MFIFARDKFRCVSMGLHFLTGRVYPIPAEYFSNVYSLSIFSIICTEEDSLKGGMIHSFSVRG